MAIAADSVSAGTIAAIIIGVLVATAFLIGVLLLSARFAERMERNPRYLRRALILFGALYIFSSTLAITKVVLGKEPPLSLIGLPVAAIIAWACLRVASRTKVPPK